MRCRNCHGGIPDTEIEAKTSADDEGLLKVTATCPCCQCAFFIQVDIFEMDSVSGELRKFSQRQTEWEDENADA